MKIALFTNSSLPYVSGISVAVQTLKEALEERGHEVFIVGPQYPGYTEKDAHCLHFFSFPAPYPGYRIVLPVSLAVFKRLKKEKINLIHVHQPFEVGLSALWTAKRLGVPLVYTFHTLFTRYVHHIPFFPQRAAKMLLSLYLRFFCNQANAVVVPSTLVRRYLHLLGVKTKVSIIPTGITFNKLKTKNAKLKIKEKYYIPSHAKLLLTSCRLAEEKNLPFLLHTFSAIQEKAPNTYLLVVGGGPEEQKLRQLAQKLSSQIIFAGAIAHAEIYDYYSAADLFVYASRSETQGLVLAEAKAAGLPVVAVFSGGVADVVRKEIDGYLVPQNAALFVKRVLQLLEDDALREKMSIHARQDAKERFSASFLAKKMEDLYLHINKKSV